MARVVFMGSPAFAVPSLDVLHAEGHEIVAVYSQPPRPAGRGQKLQKTAVHVRAEELGLAVFTPERLRGEALEAVMGIKADVFCVVAYGLLLPKKLVDERLCLNVHPSRLPRWRGAAPLQWTLLSGDTLTDVCIMKLDEGMDTGPVVERQEIEVPEDMTLGELHEVASTTGAMLLAEVVDNLVLKPGKVPYVDAAVQVGEPTHAPKITSEMRVIDWSRDAAKVHNKVRGLSPAPGAVARLGDEVFKVLRSEPVVVAAGKVMGAPGTVLEISADGIVVACGEGAIRLHEVQRPGGKAGAASEIARGWVELRKGVKFT